MCKDFFKFTPQHLEVAKNLKVNELKLWLYLSLLDPFGDRSIDLPSLEEIEEKTGLKKSAYYKARTKLVSLGLWNFTEKKTIATNLFSRLFLKNKTPESEKVNSIPENSENSLINQDLIPKNSENESLEALSINDSGLSQTIQTSTDLSDQSDAMKDKRMQNVENAECRIKNIEDDGLMNEKVEEEKPIQRAKERNATNCKYLQEQPKELINQSPCPNDKDKRLENEEFIRYAQGLFYRPPILSFLVGLSMIFFFLNHSCALNLMDNTSLILNNDN